MSENNGSVALATQAQGPIEQVRQRGVAAVADRQVLRDMCTMIQGVEWGSGNTAIQGAHFSPHTLGAFAKFCVVTRANPQIHVDILGGKPYLNAQYYRDKLSSDPYFIDDEQINLSPRLSEQLRDQARAAIAEAKEMGLPEPTGEIQNLLAQAREIERTRAEWDAPEWATSVIETRIRRYTENAPIDAIKSGEIDGTPYIRLIRECNWAGGKGRVVQRKRDGSSYEREADPIGDLEPAKTARTRSFRRCARNAFSAWFDQFDDDVKRATEIVGAEWREITVDNQAAQAALPSGTGLQGAVTGDGEPSAGNAEDARALPIEDARGEVERQQSTSDNPAKPAFDKADARKRYFATLRDAGIAEADRAEWQKENGLPESSKEWGEGEFSRAHELLVGPNRAKYLEGCKLLGEDPARFASIALNRRVVSIDDLQLREIIELQGRVTAQLDAE